MSHLRHLTSRGECQEFVKNQNPIHSICFELGTQNQMDSWKEVPVFWTLPNNSEYSDAEVKCPPENCKLLKNAEHQKGTLRKAYLASNGKLKK